ncbi:hypothetical protein [Nonomuraea sp. 10N515B]|uniref:hypothetical protein n=1 Tax=Nonomuraea sp. 10N515B TaxID=3457422 RepID=UPI003FCE134E
MPARSRLHAEAFTISSARNYWEFPAPPIDAEIVRAVGSAINRQHLVRVDYTGDGAPVTLTLEPHDLVVWAVMRLCDLGSGDLCVVPSRIVSKFSGRRG